MRAHELRESFLKYFEKNGHARVASSSLVPANDPTLFFTNAGMVQFKDAFLGNERREYKRATTSQKCMRVSGKHNDLENVGHTPRHHTFFEMLGNFSFGDYFKKEAIAYAWEYLTRSIGLPKGQLYATVFKDDDEAEKLWTKHVDKSRIFRLDEKDNFWSMGETGPCGPCSEILFDRNPGEKVTAADLDTDRFMEIWNLVFMQFNRSADGKMAKLARPSIDTGMGLERLAAVVENVSGNYETDLFMPVITEIEKIAHKKYGRQYGSTLLRRSVCHSRESGNPVQINALDPHFRGDDMAGNDTALGDADDVSMRVIADHIRAMAFLIGDGVQPSNEGRGYVLRRIIRRAARHGKLLKIEKPFFVPLAHIVIDIMGSAYPELIQHKGFIEKVIANEEERFNETLTKGLEILDAVFKELSKGDAKVLPGKDVFEIYDTYGFPKDLTEDIAREAGFTIDSEGFEKLMTEQRERARSAWKGSGEEAAPAVYKELGKKGVSTQFVGYKELSSDARVLSIIKKGSEVDSAGAKEKISFIVDKTPFYGESGGQMGDIGMCVADDLEITIDGASRPLTSLIVHNGTIEKGELKKGARITLAVDAERRSDIMRNHSATHILHQALRETLGEHVKQSGSMVAPDRLRFDFSHFSALTLAELREVEQDANRIIRMNLPVCINEMAHKEAVQKGALAFFGEKYGETVRMVSMGDYSIELCGGTHVGQTGEIGSLKITGESGVAAGIRRIEAVTGKGVEEYIKKMETERESIAEILKVSAGEVPARVEKLLNEVKKFQKELEGARAKLLSGKSEESPVETIGNVKFMARLVEGADPKELRNLSDDLKTRIGSGVVMLATEADSKTSVLITVSNDLTKKLQAGNLMKEMIATIGGTGGGRPDMAQGGAGGTGKFNELKEKLKEIIGRL